jgi:hypothetical protein
MASRHGQLWSVGGGVKRWPAVLSRVLPARDSVGLASPLREVLPADVDIVLCCADAAAACDKLSHYRRCQRSFASAVCAQ